MMTKPVKISREEYERLRTYQERILFAFKQVFKRDGIVRCSSMLDMSVEFEIMFSSTEWLIIKVFLGSDGVCLYYCRAHSPSIKLNLKKFSDTIIHWLLELTPLDKAKAKYQAHEMRIQAFEKVLAYERKTLDVYKAEIEQLEKK